MQKIRILGYLAALLVTLSLATNAFADGKITGGKSYTIPEWFKDSFLTLADDIEEAGEEQKTVMLFFHLDGCPYCDKMLAESYAQNKDYIQKNFDTIALNIRGDREVTTMDDEPLTEKQMAKRIRVLFTPTIVFLDGKGKTVFRINGYWPPKNFREALEYVKAKGYEKGSLRKFVEARKKEGIYKLKPNAMFKDVKDLSTIKTPLALVFENKHCADCETIHTKLFASKNIQEAFKSYTVVRLDNESTAALKGLDGKDTTAKDLASSLKVSFAPSIILFDEGKEQHRVEGRLFNNHFETSLLYVSGKHYKKHPRWLDYQSLREKEIMSQGKDVNIGPMH